jgi:hypothetical protein
MQTTSTRVRRGVSRPNISATPSRCDINFTAHTAPLSWDILLFTSIGQCPAFRMRCQGPRSLLHDHHCKTVGKHLRPLRLPPSKPPPFNFTPNDQHLKPLQPLLPSPPLDLALLLPPQTYITQDCSLHSLP